MSLVSAGNLFHTRIVAGKDESRRRLVLALLLKYSGGVCMFLFRDDLNIIKVDVFHV